ncbi:MAG: cellulase family glycosylhydrolase [Solirubrobacteraceae bacterium]|nr:cellulase family glycosylhydrolase [Solirubrobacteraceae bacterium]
MTHRKTTTFVMAAFALLLGILAGASTAAASTKQTMFFEAPRDLTARTSTDATRATAFAAMEKAGVKALRVNVQWYDVAPNPDDAATPAFDPTDPNGYYWGNYAAAIDAAKAKGWTVLISLAAPVPKWATADKSDNVKRPIPAEYAKFATAAAKRFGASNVLWSIWNEPNLPRYLSPQISGGKYVGAQLYRELFEAGRQGIRAGGQTTAKVLFGELAPVGGSNDGRVYPLTFLRAAFCLSSRDKYDKKCGAKLQLDGVAHHPYQFTNGKLNKNDVTYRNLSSLTKFLDKAGKAKAISTKVPVYFTEFGIQSYPDKTFGVSPQRQYEIRARVERDAYYNSRVAGFSQYLFTDDTDNGGFQTGLYYANGKAKPSYAAFISTLDAKPVKVGKRYKKVSLWGIARSATKATTVVVEKKRGKSFKTWKKVKTKSNGAFTVTDSTYKSSAQYRFRWTSPSGKVTSPAVRVYKG